MRKLALLLVLLVCLPAVASSIIVIKKGAAPSCSTPSGLDGTVTVWLNFDGTCTSTTYTVDHYDASTNPTGTEFVNGATDTTFTLANTTISCDSTTPLIGNASILVDSSGTSVSDNSYMWINFSADTPLLAANEGSCFGLFNISSAPSGAEVGNIYAGTGTTFPGGDLSGHWWLQGQRAAMKWNGGTSVNAGFNTYPADSTTFAMRWGWQTDQATDHLRLIRNTTETFDSTASQTPVTWTSGTNQNIFTIGPDQGPDVGIWELDVIVCSTAYSDMSNLHTVVCGAADGTCTGGQQGNYCN